VWGDNSGGMELLEQVLAPLMATKPEGHYDESQQVWSVEASAQLSPQKFNQEN
jgi:hypothetical protein